MSRYDVLHPELSHLRRRRRAALGIPAAAAALGTVPLIGALPAAAALAVVGAAVAAAVLVFHLAFRAAWPAYGAWVKRSAWIAEEIARLRTAVATMAAAYPVRVRGTAFKRAYQLSGRAVTDFEHALAVGMLRERREVFVTAFTRDGVVVRVTAAIGSPSRCRPADDPRRWRAHVDRLRCTEVRQYHNHPVHGGTTAPSRTDVRTARSVQGLLGPHGDKLRTFVICWNALGEWRLFEYDGQARCWLHRELDVATAGPAR